MPKKNKLNAQDFLGAVYGDRLSKTFDSIKDRLVERAEFGRRMSELQRRLDWESQRTNTGARKRKY